MKMIVIVTDTVTNSLTIFLITTTTITIISIIIIIIIIIIININIDISSSYINEEALACINLKKKRPNIDCINYSSLPMKAIVNIEEDLHSIPLT